MGRCGDRRLWPVAAVRRAICRPGVSRTLLLFQSRPREKSFCSKPKSALMWKMQSTIPPFSSHRTSPTGIRSRHLKTEAQKSPFHSQRRGSQSESSSRWETSSPPNLASPWWLDCWIQPSGNGPCLALWPTLLIVFYAHITAAGWCDR